MLKVYVVTHWWAYEGEEVYGVFSNRELAEQFIEQEPPGNKRAMWEGYDIEEYVLDNPIVNKLRY